MAFTRTVQTEPYAPSQFPILDESRRTHLMSELRRLSITINKMHGAIEEIQEYLEAQP